MTDALLNYIEAEKQKAYDRGQCEATAINLGGSGYDSCQTSVVAVEFTSFQQLRSEIRSRRGRRSGENPGQAYLWTCEPIFIHHGDYSKVALLRCSTHYDI